MLANPRRIYALVGYTVELRQKGWFYWPTYEKGETKGPYGSMASVTLMIARELKREIAKRDKPRLAQVHLDVSAES